MSIANNITASAAASTAAASAASAATDRQAEVEELVREFAGKAPPVGRSQDDLKRAYARVIGALISAEESRGVEGPPKHVLEEIIVRAGAPGREEQCRCLARAMLAYFEKTDDLNQRIFLLRQLGVVGREESVAALAGLLGEHDAALRQYALRALEMNASAAAGKAIAKALGHADDPDWRVALINALGPRREASAVGILGNLATTPSEAVAEAAAMALGNIGTPESAERLAEARKNARQPQANCWIRANLLCADRLFEDGHKPAAAAIYRDVQGNAETALFRMAGLRGLALCSPDEAVPLVVEALGSEDRHTRAQAARLVVSIPGPKATEALLAALPKLPGPAQALLLEALAERESHQKATQR